jgi:hypothetical protein
MNMPKKGKRDSFSDASNECSSSFQFSLQSMNRDLISSRRYISTDGSGAGNTSSKSSGAIMAGVPEPRSRLLVSPACVAGRNAEIPKSQILSCLNLLRRESHNAMPVHTRAHTHTDTYNYHGCRVSGQRQRDLFSRAVTDQAAHSPPSCHDARFLASEYRRARRRSPCTSARGVRGQLEHQTCRDGRAGRYQERLSRALLPSSA